MDSVSGYAGPRQPRTGGKILRPRRSSVVRRTPYDRPAPRPHDPPQQNPSWISRLVYKPATAIASGAGKFISSVVFSESSSSSSEGEDSSSDIESDEDVEKNITDFPQDETMDCVNAQQSTIQRLGSKLVIEQLLMQETFARQEGDRLIDIIKARVVDHPSVIASNEGSDIGMTSEVNVGEMSSKAAMEAKRWLEEKKSAPHSKSKVTEDGAGSPVDVARSYMRYRLPWGSPSVNNSEFRSPLPAGMQFLNEGTPFPYSSGNLSSSKLKRRSRSNPSWNIQDEIRKVRAKATEEMLKTASPSSVALVSLGPKHIPFGLDASLNVDGGVEAVRNEQSGVLPNSITPTSEQNQTTEANQAVEETGALHSIPRGVGLDYTFVSTQGVKPSEDTNTASQSGTGVHDDFIQPSSTTVATTNAVLALGASKDVFETSKEADEVGAVHHTSNGFPSSSPSSPVAMEGQPKPKPPDETEASQPVAETPDDGKIDKNENNNSGSSASPSTHEEEWLPKDQSLPNSNPASSSPGITKVLAYTRRGRDRGRGRGRDKGRGK